MKLTIQSIASETNSNNSSVRFSDLLFRLNAWFAETARLLPWRSEPTPYRVWISEIMLQQTVVSAVIPYFNRFIRRFPDVQSLADASLDDVLALWSGLGYYSRAKNLHKTAQLLARGGFPQTRSGWEALPGVGPYTAGAVLSIAFDQPEAILDGNIERVWSRFRCLERNADFKTRLWRLSRLTVDVVCRSGLSPSIINQALMELGALVCRPSSPDCAFCPFSPRCLALRRGVQTDYPQRRRRAEIELLEETVCVYMLGDGRVYLPSPNDTQRWRKGMRDFPIREIEPFKARARFIGQTKTTHAVTRYKITRTANVFLLEQSPPEQISDFYSDLSEVPHSGACRKTFESLKKNGLIKE